VIVADRRIAGPPPPSPGKDCLDARLAEADQTAAV
jgi:hypothetical protein